jgi:hypothetical protein
MICNGCGEEIQSDFNVCPKCGMILKEKIKIVDREKEINKYFIKLCSIIVGSIFAIGIIVLIVWLILENKKVNFVSKYCDGGSYVENVSIADIVSGYDCTLFASYMVDTKGKELTFVHLEYLSTINDIALFEIFSDITNSDFSYWYSDMIYSPAYYDYLVMHDVSGMVNDDTYNSLALYSYENGDFELYSALLRCFFEVDGLVYLNNIEKKFGQYYGYSKITSDIINQMKKDSVDKVDYILEYAKYKDIYYPIYMFNEELFKRIPSGEVSSSLMFEGLAGMSYILSLDDLKNYRSYGGKFFYDSKVDIIDIYLEDFLSDSNYEAKLRYLITEAKKDGYDVTYSSALDNFMDDNYYYAYYDRYGYKNTVKNAYSILVNAGFKCYSYCSYSDRFRW